MSPAPSVLRSRVLQSILFGTLIAGTLALPTSSAAVVFCTPTGGEIPTLKISPAAVPPPAVGKYGLKLKATIDGCVADAAKLADWIPSKNGTADGASIAKAELSLAVTGFGNCGFGLSFLPGNTTPGAYDPVGTLKINWLDANGDKIKSAKPSSVFLRMTPLTASQVGSFVSTGSGIVTKGLGIGGTARLTIPLDFPIDLSGPWGACLTGILPVPPGFPPLPPPVPLEAFALTRPPSLNISFPAAQ
jgi:hypothetical protein